MLKFNIIYIPGTVKHLQLFVFSLLKWSDCSFRLVANGCSVKEIDLLQQLCRKSSRLEFLALPSKTIMTHGEAVTFLHSLERSDFFCFMDSDILATGDFLRDLTASLNHYAGVFSAPPVWIKAEEQILPGYYDRISGHHHKTSSDLCLGSTYFAIYNNELATNIIQVTSVDFQEYRWQDIPSQIQDQLSSMKMERKLYDTGKVLNLLLQFQEKHLMYLEVPTLQHIGGISVQANIKNDKLASMSRFNNLLYKLLFWLPESNLRQLIILKANDLWLPIRSRRIGMKGKEARQYRLRILRKKNGTSLYFQQVLQSLIEDQSLPTVPDFGESGVERNIEHLTQNIVDLYEEFREQFV